MELIHGTFSCGADVFTHGLLFSVLTRCAVVFLIYHKLQTSVLWYWRYVTPLVGGTRRRGFAGIKFKPRKTLEDAQTPTSWCMLCWAVLHCQTRYLTGLVANPVFSVTFQRLIDRHRTRVPLRSAQRSGFQMQHLTQSLQPCLGVRSQRLPKHQCLLWFGIEMP